MLGVVGRDGKGQRIHQKRRIPGWEEMGMELDDGIDGVPLMTRTLPETPRGPKDEGDWFAPAVKGGWMEINALWANSFLMS